MLQPSAFADSWGSRPAAPVAIGLRFVSVEDLEIARNVAVDRARKWQIKNGAIGDLRAFDETYNDELVMVIVARATTDPNDVDAGYFRVAEDTVRVALTAEGARRLYDELCILHAGSGIQIAAASDEDVRLLGKVLGRGKALARSNARVALEVRKLCTYLLEQLTGDSDEPLEETDQDEVVLTDEGDEVAVYEASGG